MTRDEDIALLRAALWYARDLAVSLDGAVPPVLRDAPAALTRLVGPAARRPLAVGPCPCECNRGGFCGGCGHAGCSGGINLRRS
jgi:hypothetical protein